MSGTWARSRGPRRTPRIDLTTAAWERNEYGVDVLVLSRDPRSGALTMALRTPAGLDYPEREHFYDCDQDLFQFEGEFHHDEELPLTAGDYLWRPAGTVYGHSEGSAGGIILASLGRQPRRYHLSEHPYDWSGHYRVDRLWNRRAEPFCVPAGDQGWVAGGDGIRLRPLRGDPGLRCGEGGASGHSPWAAESVFLLALAAGRQGPFPAWSGMVLETLVIGGRATVDGSDWYRGCYAFDGLRGDCRVVEPLTVYCRAFQSGATAD